MTAPDPVDQPSNRSLPQALGIDLAVLIQNVGVNLSDHVRLCVARIALRCLDVTVVQLQLIGRAGVPEGVENHIRKVCVPFQSVEGIADHPILAGTAIIQGKHQIIIIVRIPQIRFGSVLAFLPGSQQSGKGHRDPHLTDTGFRFRLLQYQPGLGLAVNNSRESKEYVILSQSTHCLGFLQRSNKLVHHTGIHILNIYLPNNRVDIVPDQACIGGAHRQPPLSLAIHIHKVNEKLLDLYGSRRNECTGIDLVLNLTLALLGFLLGCESLPFLLEITVRVFIAKN